MSVVKEKKFVMKHVFTDIMNMEKGKEYFGSKERHFTVPWAISIFKTTKHDVIKIYFECMNASETNDWSIETEIKVKLFDNSEEKCFEKISVYDCSNRNGGVLKIIYPPDLNNFLVDGNMTVECHVKITKMTGIVWKKLRNFDESMKEFSDVVLVVNEEKFYVWKMYLATHSTYFKSLFSGNFNESEQSEIELKDIDLFDFQNFLELLYGDSDVKDDTVFGILKLADMYDANSPIRRCEEFLIDKSKHSLKEKFEAAVTYKMEKLKGKCMSEMKSSADVWSVVPEDGSKFDHTTWKELLRMAIDFK